MVAVWVLFVPAADWLAHHDVGSVQGSLHEMALDNAQGRLLTLGAGLFAADALWFTARSFTLSREGQVTDRYTKAIEQLGSEKLDVRIGGIYALERVSRDSKTDYRTVMEVLTAFIREHSHEQRPPPGSDGRDRTRADIQAAFTVIGRRDETRGFRYIDLTGADLTGARLDDANLFGVNLTNANLTGAHLYGVNLSSAYLNDAILTGANLTGAHLVVAFLTGANLTGADLVSTDLSGAVLTRANFTGANLTGAK